MNDYNASPPSVRSRRARRPARSPPSSPTSSRPEPRIRPGLLAGHRHQPGAARAGLDGPEIVDASRNGRPDAAARPDHARDHRAGGLGDQRLTLLPGSHTAALRKLGLDDEALGEVMAIVGLFNMTNSLANGYQIEPDVRPRVD